MTVVVGDLAALFGCTIGLSDASTAITFVALGTSLPDLFASKGAAQADPTADASIGNVTGSNSVNVFLGLGMPWMAAAFYWTHNGQTDEWKTRNPEYIDKYPDGGFIVRAGSLGYSVSVFCTCAVLTIFTFVVRRLTVGGELGGPAVCKWVSFAFMVSLWFVYVFASLIKNEGLEWKTFPGEMQTSAERIAGVGEGGSNSERLMLLIILAIPIGFCVMNGKSKPEHEDGEEASIPHEPSLEGGDRAGDGEHHPESPSATE